MKSRALAISFATLTALSSGTVFAQTESLLIQPALPDDFDRGRNTSVTQRPRPEYDALGITAGSFKVYPTVDVALGYSSNVYYSDTDAVSDGYVMFSPAVRVVSDWSRHRLELRADTDIQRFFTETKRNQEPWNVQALGMLELGDHFRLLPEGQIARQFETPFSGDTASDQSVLSNYLRKFVGLRGEYSAGQTKLTLAIDNSNYQFSDVELRSGNYINQSDRDRNSVRVTGQGQYAFTPSLAAYVQGSYSHTVYDRNLLTGFDNRDSDGYRFIGGVNFDLAALVRGTIGVGYTWRDYKSPIYRDVKGFSAEAKFEYFPSELTTFTLQLRRAIEDSSLGLNSAYFDNRASLRVDHELLYNLILNASGEFAQQDYIDLSDKSDIYRFSAGAVYLSSNSLSLNFNLAYTQRSPSDTNNLGQKFNEFRGQVGVTFKR